MIDTSALDNFDGSLLLTDLDSRVIWANENAIRRLPLKAGDLLTNLLNTKLWLSLTEVVGPLPVTICQLEGCSDEVTVTGCREGSKCLLIITEVTGQPALLEFGHVIHDIKNPLGAIFGYADTLLDPAISTGLSSKQKELVERMRATASRTIDMVKNYELLTVLDKNISQAPTHSIDLNKSLQDVLGYTCKANMNDIQVHQELFSGDLDVRIDRISLERLLANLITNALKYSEKGSAVFIETSLVDHVPQFSIRNSCVIPPSEQDSIFERSVRGSTSRGQAGTGLGLYIVKTICDYYGATIALTSNAKIGTEIQVRFPKQD